MGRSTAPRMDYYVDSGGAAYVCWVAYRPASEIADIDVYRKAHSRARFVYELDAKWFCQKFNDAVALGVEPFQ